LNRKLFKAAENARLLENTNRFSSCDVMLPKPSLSYGKRNSLKTPQRAVFAREEAEAFPMENEYFPQRWISTHLRKDRRKSRSSYVAVYTNYDD